jgi:hypothetical protein
VKSEKRKVKNGAPPTLFFAFRFSLFTQNGARPTLFFTFRFSLFTQNKCHTFPYICFLFQVKLRFMHTYCGIHFGNKFLTINQFVFYKRNNYPILTQQLKATHG